MTIVMAITAIAGNNLITINVKIIKDSKEIAKSGFNGT